ncbi:zinc-ribbon domain-containing protein [Methanobrevibacter acididurans]|uniref:zinc ribbon domain-containing protein n=1 Tax=Methanobrevibacter TaxID=2172 RepID=UPI0038FC17D0
MVKYCPECGAELEDTHKFCPECGHKFDKKVTNKETEDIKSKITNTKIDKSTILNKKVIVGVIAAIIVIFGIIFVADYLTPTESPDTNLQFQIVDINQNIYKFNDGGYGFYINGEITNLPSNTDPYTIKAEFFDFWGNALGVDTRNVTQSGPTNGQFSLASYGTDSGIKPHHVVIEIKNGQTVCGKTTYKINTNNMPTF